MPFYQPDPPHPPGRVYLVGGAVRDHLLGEPSAERDWVVVDATPQDMLDAGYRTVGADFPVFLHPDNHEEYALARTERKSGRGYHGFEVQAGPGVTLEQDLARRDLTINAIAMDGDGQLVDPHGGGRDLGARQLRHVTEAFREDPLRVLRVARFAARLDRHGFTIADDTRRLMSEMAASGELADLTPERVWRELDRMLSGPAPQVAFRVLQETGALAVLLPELDRQFGVPQPAKYHPEIDCGLHTLLALEQARRLDASPRVMYAVLCHDFGKGTTPSAILPSHRGHEARGVDLANAVSARYKVPRAHAELAALTAELHLLCHKARELRAKTLLKLLDRLDAWRRPERLEEFLLACEADARGRTGLEDAPYPQPDYLRGALAAASGVDARALAAGGLEGAALGKALRRERLAALEVYRSQHAH